MRTILNVAALALALATPALAQSKQVYDVGKEVTAPRLVREVKPTYTQSAKDRKVQGWVQLSAVVQADGTVGDPVKITKSLDEELDQEAIKALKQWTFTPGQKDGAPVAVRVDVELSFKLK